jgi:hypothetical protein
VAIQETDEVSIFIAEALGTEAPSRNLDGDSLPTSIETERTLETFTLY